MLKNDENLLNIVLEVEFVWNAAQKSLMQNARNVILLCESHDDSDYTSHVRNDVLAHHNLSHSEPDLSISTDTDTFKRVLIGMMSVEDALSLEKISTDNNSSDVIHFFSIFDSSIP